MISPSLARDSRILLVALAQPAARVIALACVVAAALAVLRVRRVSMRLFAWTTVLYAALGIALAGWLVPAISLPVPGAIARFVPAEFKVPASIESAKSKAIVPTAQRSQETFAPRVAARELPSAKTNRAAAPQQTLAGAAKLNVPNVLPSASVATPAESSARNSSIAQVAAAPKYSWIFFAATSYLFFSLLLLARIALGLVMSMRLDRASKKISDRDALRRLSFRAYASGLENPPRLAESEMLTVPATLGIFRPVIVFPSNWRAWEAAELDAILAHEVSHVARHDAFTQLFSLIHRAVFWFSPVAWWLDRRLSELAEEASDEAALAAGADRTRYAETLLGFFADVEAAPGRIWWQGVSMAKAGTAARRVDHILAWQGSARLKKSSAIAVLALAAPAIFLAASLHPVAAHAQQKTPAQSQNIVQAGGPKAPALPAAPKGGVVAPALPNAPQTGVVAPAMAPAPAGAITEIPASTPFAATPAFPPAAPADPLAPPPELNAPTVPSTLGTPGAPAISFRAQSQSNASSSSSASDSSNSPQSVTARLRAAQKTMEEAKLQLAPAEENLHAAEKALLNARAQAIPRSLQIAAAEHALQEAQEKYRPARAQLDLALAAIASAEQELQQTKLARPGASWFSNNSVTISGASNLTIGGDYHGSGPRYVMMLGKSNCLDTACEVEMSGNDEDLQHARELRHKISGDFIWFERDEKSYIITDPDFIAKAKALFAPEDALAKQQDELGRQQDALGRQQDALGDQMDSVKVKVPDVSSDLVQIQARLKDLQAGGATQSQLGVIQSQLGELQSQIGRFQSQAGGQQSVIGRQQSELGKKQGELGREQGELGRKQAALSRQISEQLREMFDGAISKGIAKPE